MWVGRSHENVRPDRQPHIPITSDGHISRYHMMITYEEESRTYWIQDLLTQFPAYLLISSKSPILLT